MGSEKIFFKLEKENCLIIFVKNPALGKVKTRLAEEIGDGPALAVYLKLVNHTRSVTQNLSGNKIVYYSDFVDMEDEWENELFRKSLQSGSDLGIRMKNAFSDQFNSGYRKVCIIGSDIPELSGEIIIEAFNILETTDAVIGPAHDGGYYLLGMKKLIQKVFENKEWGNHRVFESTMENFRSLNLTCHQLSTLLDIDTKNDLEKAWPQVTWREK